MFFFILDVLLFTRSERTNKPSQHPNVLINLEPRILFSFYLSFFKIKVSTRVALQRIRKKKRKKNQNLKVSLSFLSKRRTELLSLRFTDRILLPLNNTSTESDQGSGNASYMQLLALRQSGPRPRISFKGKHTFVQRRTCPSRVSVSSPPCQTIRSHR